MPFARLPLAALCASLLLLGACRSAPDTREEPVASDVVGEAAKSPYPASYAGELPCRDCERIEARLNLFGDGVYYLQETHRGGASDGVVSDDIGRWSRTGEKSLRLDGGRETPLLFDEDAGGALLSADGGSHRFERDATLRVLEPRIHLRGMFVALGGGARFHDCLTGRDIEVATDADYAALDRAYAANDPSSSGQPVLATVDGRIAQRPKTDSPQLQSALVVERFRKLWPGESCSARYVDADLFGTTWKLAQIDGRLAIAAPEGNPGTLMLDEGAQRASGSTGCNRYTSAFAMEDGQVRFSPAAMTRMACPAPAMLQETAFAAMLDKAARLKVSGQQLEVLDEAGAVIARFDVMPLPVE
ncbi:META domain-containing protein [Arenimonas sp.]|uniref:META domain-containing protein n=1 Tax=Arenimonas sp. TaxID=1872635 RepID=UPI0039E6D69A